MYVEFIENCFFNRLRYSAESILETFLTDYIRTTVDINKIKSNYDLPIAVHFGKKLLSWNFVCASNNQFEQVLSQERIEYDILKKLVQRYGFVVKSQEMLLTGLVTALASQDERALLRHKFLSTRKRTKKIMLAARLKSLYVPAKGEWKKVTFPLVQGPATDEEISVLDKLTKGTFESEPAIEKMIRMMFTQQHQFKHLWHSLVGKLKPIGFKKSTKNMVSSKVKLSTLIVLLAQIRIQKANNYQNQCQFVQKFLNQVLDVLALSGSRVNHVTRRIDFARFS